MSTYYTGSLGLGLRRPCRFCDGSSSEYSQMLLAPQFTSWWTICRHQSLTYNLTHIIFTCNYINDCTRQTYVITPVHLVLNLKLVFTSSVSALLWKHTKWNLEKNLQPYCIINIVWACTCCCWYSWKYKKQTSAKTDVSQQCLWIAQMKITSKLRGSSSG